MVLSGQPAQQWPEVPSSHSRLRAAIPPALRPAPSPLGSAQVLSSVRVFGSPAAVSLALRGSLAALPPATVLSLVSVPSSPSLPGALLPVTQPPATPFGLGVWCVSSRRDPRQASALPLGPPRPLIACRSRCRSCALFVLGSPILSTIPVTQCV